jgi:hypothetical protein
MPGVDAHARRTPVPLRTQTPPCPVASGTFHPHHRVRRPSCHSCGREPGYSEVPFSNPHRRPPPGARRAGRGGGSERQDRCLRRSAGLTRTRGARGLWTPLRAIRAMSYGLGPVIQVAPAVFRTFVSVSEAAGIPMPLLRIYRQSEDRTSRALAVLELGFPQEVSTTSPGVALFCALISGTAQEPCGP